MGFRARLRFAFSRAFSFVEPFAVQLKGRMGNLLLSKAEEAIKIVENSLGDHDGSEKRELAFSRIVDGLKKEGVQIGRDVGKSMINATIEIALQKHRSENKAK